ncbi:N-acetylmannosaminyltransferase [Acidisarcina polymorpha]|uniref:N-acetylmannosaminyltransferase n=1 Tax=Acidisarcina polymorpha TaxID=2211140 RepID=A0A2Z5FYB5_9BACT|nr:WecB/TagA/CpsF family glycosyltransferase [Acidisarcina polymorpha]AXC11848.1 N-acetylmannosaminyltransferase [Acidisarcina polymorpha]
MAKQVPPKAQNTRLKPWPADRAADRAWPAGERVIIGAVALDAIDFEGAVTWALDSMKTRAEHPPRRIVSPNAWLVALADADPGFASLLRSFNLVVADGLPLVWAASLLGTPLRGQIRGVDLMENICEAAAAHRMSFYVLGGLSGAAEIAARRLTLSYPGLRLAGIDSPPLGFEADDLLKQQVRDKIAAAAPDFLIVALGSPKQEWWIHENCRDLPVGVIQGVGAAIDTYAGLRKRPPRWMRVIGLEWFGRLLAEPKRLWRRYLLGNPRFLWIIFRQWFRARR